MDTLLTPYQLQLPGKILPPALPLILPSGYVWSAEEMCVRSEQEGSPAHLWVNEDAIKLLKTVKKPVAVLSICGPYRTGKSYFLSHLLHRPSLFRLGHSMEVCTRGIWLSTIALECEEFVCLLLDTEGIGAVEGNESSSVMKLLVITSLLSSTLVYNSNEVPQHSDLEQMRYVSIIQYSLLNHTWSSVLHIICNFCCPSLCSLFTHLSKCVSITTDATHDSKPEQFQRYFPNFVWLLRNVINLPEDEDGNDIPLKTYIQSDDVCSTQQSRRVIETLQAIFPTIDYQYLPPPSADPECTTDLDSHWSQLEDKFKEKIQEVEHHLLRNLTPKHSFDQTTLITGIDLALLVRDYTDLINSSGHLPSIEGSWVAVLKLRFKSAFSEMLEKYSRMMEEKTLDLLPMEEDVPTPSDNLSLMKLHWSVFDDCFGELRTTIEHLLPHHVNDDLREYSRSLLVDFGHQVAEFESSESGDILCTETLKGGILLRFVQQNYKLSEEMCDALWERLFKESSIQNQAIKALNQSKVIDLSADMATLTEEYMKHAVGPAKHAVLHCKQTTSNVKDMLCNLPGPPVHVRLAGRDRDKHKIVWDPPIINPDAVKEYILQKKNKKGFWEDIASTDKCWVILDCQPGKECEYRVTSWNDEHNKGEMEDSLIVTKGKNIPSTCTEEITYL